MNFCVRGIKWNGNNRDCQTTASELLEELKDVNFYISLVFMRNM